MGLPELTFTLKKAAETVSTRISRGAVALILREKQSKRRTRRLPGERYPGRRIGAGQYPHTSKPCADGYINRPSAVYVSVVPAAGTIAAASARWRPTPTTTSRARLISPLKTPRRSPRSSRSAASCATSARRYCPTPRRTTRASSTLCLPVSPPAARRLSLPRLTARALRVCWPVPPRSAARPMRS